MFDRVLNTPLQLQVQCNNDLSTLNLFITVHNEDTRVTSFDVVFLFFQETYTCSKSTIETIEKGVKYVKS